MVDSFQRPVVQDCCRGRRGQRSPSDGAIYPDGTYWPDCALDHCSAFYYGGDGPSPRRKITILSTAASVGASADIAIDFGYSPAPTGALSALVVDATNLRFTFSAAWFSCGQPFDVDLTRY